MRALGNGWDSGTYENGKKPGKGVELKIQEKDNNDGGRSLRKEREMNSRGQVEAKTGDGESDCHCQRREGERGKYVCG